MKRVKNNDGRGEHFKYSGRFPRVSPKRKSSHDNEYGHSLEKMSPSTYVDGIMMLVNIRWCQIYLKITPT